MQTSEMISLIVKNGIRKYKFKNSKVRPFNQQPEGNKGAVFGFRTKENMIDARGIVLTSEESLAENEDCFSHWTPNVYSYGTYADTGRTLVKGHSEDNLKQINTFIIDFDKIPGEKLDPQMIVDAAIDLDLIPTMILQTPGGYQAYFVLANAWYISSANNYGSIKIAKKVSDNLRKAFAETLESVDLGCNHFGIARIPRTDNVVYYHAHLTYDMQQMINWSMDYEPVSTANNKPFLQLVPPAGAMDQVKEKWVDILIKNPEIIGKKGRLGRNNAFFTLALAHYSSGKEESECYDFLDELNEKLNRSIKDTEVKRIVKSAYSGRYQGANKEYVLALLSNWSAESPSEDKLFTQKRTTWYKFKKERSERKQSHLHEWKADVLVYLESVSFTYRPEFKLQKADIIAAVKYQDKSIPKRSLDRALNELKAEGKIFVEVKAGRNGGLCITTRKAVIKTVILVKKEVKEAYKAMLRREFPSSAILTNVQENELLLTNSGSKYKQINLWDSG